MLGRVWLAVGNAVGATLHWPQAGFSCVHTSVVTCPEEWSSPPVLGNISVPIPISNVALCTRSPRQINLTWIRQEWNYISVILADYLLWNLDCSLCWTIPDLMLEWNWQMIPCMAWSTLRQKLSVKRSWKNSNWSNGILQAQLPASLVPRSFSTSVAALLKHNLGHTVNSFESSAAAQLVAPIHAEKTFFNIAIIENFKWIDAFERLPRKYISF